jgi:hypothetical protein
LGERSRDGRSGGEAAAGIALPDPVVLQRREGRVGQVDGWIQSPLTAIFFALLSAVLASVYWAQMAFPAIACADATNRKFSPDGESFL